MIPSFSLCFWTSSNSFVFRISHIKSSPSTVDSFIIIPFILLPFSNFTNTKESRFLVCLRYLNNSQISLHASIISLLWSFFYGSGRLMLIKDFRCISLMTEEHNGFVLTKANLSSPSFLPVIHSLSDFYNIRPWFGPLSLRCSQSAKERCIHKDLQR